MKTFTAVLMGLLLMAASTAAQAQGVQQQQMTQQQMQRMEQMHAMQQHMTRLMERTHQMSQNMHRHMLQAQSEQLRNQFRQMERLGDDLHATAGQLKNAIERAELIYGDREMLRDRDMDRDMDQIRLRLQDMTNQLDEAVQSMDRMSTRLRQHAQN